MPRGTREIIAQLVEEVSWTARAKLLEQLATRFAQGGLEDGEWQAVTDAFRVALYDGEPLVRRVLAESLKNAPDVPRDILLALARDSAAVAAPILEHSKLFDEEELLVLVAHGTAAHWLAMVSRSTLSNRVAEELCRTGDKTVIQHLLLNDGADLSEDVLHWLLDTFPDFPDIAEAIGRRRLLPVGVGSRLFGTLSLRRNDAAEQPALRLASDRTASRA